MNNIASQRRTELDAIQAAFPLARVALLLATAILTVVILSFRPFQPAPPPGAAASGDIVNQLGFSTLGVLSVFCLATMVTHRRLVALASPWWLAMLGFLAFSVLNALDPNAAMRAALFTLFGMVSMAAAVSLPRDGDGYAWMFLTAGLVVVGLGYFGVVAMPSVAIHSADSIEAQHAGFWRGSFAHKNIAGPVMACMAFAGLYVWRHGWRWRGGALFLLAMFFVSNTGSKTTAGLVPLVMLLIMAPRAIGFVFITPLLVWVTVLGTALGTIGIVFIAPIKDLAATFFPDLTYTGRTTLWEFLGQMIATRPWTGWGFESIWGTVRMLMAETTFDQNWDVTGSVHGHNGWLDLAAMMGLPALAVAIVTFVAVPVRDFARIPMIKENVLLADLFLMILVFAALNAFLESFFFRRADPVWLLFVMAALGLRLVARFRIPSTIRS